jgi:cytochrome c biogenesis protein CcmG/thiol:disulfide interchange protein DsbE
MRDGIPSDRRGWFIPGLIALCAAAIMLAVVVISRHSVSLAPQQERRAIPELKLKLTTGERWNLADHRGQVVAINYWASWCAPCWKETPMLVRLDRELGPRGLRIVGVAMDERESDAVPAKVTDFVVALHVTYPIALTAPMSQMAYGMEGLPTTVLVDRSGRVARTYVGAIRESAFRTDLEILLDESTGGHR